MVSVIGRVRSAEVGHLKAAAAPDLGVVCLSNREAGV